MESRLSCGSFASASPPPQSASGVDPLVPQLTSLSIRQEIQRFESVHPSIYAIYDLIELVPDPLLAQQIREHVVCIEDSFVNSQEWTLSRSVPDLRLGIVGSLSSGKSALVHRYLTGSYMQEESPEGGRFKKEIGVDGNSYLLLIRDEGGPPELQFSSWVDAVIFVFSLENETSFNAVYNYYAKMTQYRNMNDVPIILVGTQDSISENHPRIIDDSRARKLAADLKKSAYYETCATYGLNVERVFQDACQKITNRVNVRSCSTVTPTSSYARTSFPTGYLPSPTGNGYPFIGQQQNSPGQASYKESRHVPSSSHFDLPRTPGSSSVPSVNNPNNSPAAIIGSSNSGSGSETTGKFVIPTDRNLVENNKENNNSKDLPTPSSTPTSARKNRRRSNLFTPSSSSKKEDKIGSFGVQPQMGSGRSIPTKQGYLYKKSGTSFSKDWKKKYVTLCDDGRMTYHPSLHEYMENSHGKEISLQYVTVKVPGQKPRGSRTVNGGGANTQPEFTGNFALRNNPDKKSEKVLLTGYEVLKEPSGGEENELNGTVVDKLNDTPNVKKRHRRIKSNGVKSNQDCEDPDMFEFHIVSLDNKQWFFEAASSEDRDEWVMAIEQQILNVLQGNESNKTKGQSNSSVDVQVLKTIKSDVPGNTKCADCDAPNPDWASINLGILMCIECSGIHRQLGSHISRVRSLDLDEWPPGHLAVMTALGNRIANSVWETNLRTKKPGPQTSPEEKERYIVAKYSRKEFLSALPDAGVSPAGNLVNAIYRSDMRLVLLALAHASQEDVNAPLSPRDGRTPLHLAASQANLAITQLLIWANANVKVVDHEGRTSLFYARNSGCPELAELLINNGCPDAQLTGTLPRRNNSLNRNELYDKMASAVL